MRDIENPAGGSDQGPAPGWLKGSFGTPGDAQPDLAGLASNAGYLSADGTGDGNSSATRQARREGRTIEIRNDTGLSARGAVAPGQVLRARYLIEQCLGVGGKGTVFRARDLFRKSLPDAEQRVALKVLHAEHDDIEETLENMRRELHCAQSLSHSNIVNVYELDRDSDVVFFTMELLEGELLGSVLAKHRPKPIDRQQAWQMIRQIGAGVRHAHERGVVHGDLKPANIMVTREGELRILDFGSSKRFTPGQTVTGGSGRSSATLAYASCEQLEGRPADPRDDLYAFACICFELLSGAHPFDRRPASLVRDFGVLPKRPTGLSPRQWRTLQSGLSWHRAGRSMSAHSFVQRLVGDRDGEPRSTRLEELKSWTPRHTEWRARAPVAVLAALVAVGACVTQWGATPGPQIAPVADRTLSAPESVTWWEPEQNAGAPADDRAEPASDPESAPPQRAVARRLPLTIAVQGYHVGAGDRFVEIRVGRNAAVKNGTFAWWTEPATARQDVDYVAQSKAIQTFGDERRSTRLYVKLIPESGRAQRDYFYLAIAQPGSKRPDAVTRTQIWLPMPRGQLQAQR